MRILRACLYALYAFVFVSAGASVRACVIACACANIVIYQCHRPLTIVMFLISHHRQPIYFQNWTLIPNCNVHKHDTRNKHELYTYRVKHKYAKKCLRHNLPLILNNISHLVKEKINTPSMLGFVKYVKHHLLQSYRETCTISNCYTCMHNC